MATGRGARRTSGGSVRVARDNVAAKAGAEPLWKDGHLFRTLFLRRGAVPLLAIHEEFASRHAMGFGMDLSFRSDDDSGRYIGTLAGSGGSRRASAWQRRLSGPVGTYPHRSDDLSPGCAPDGRGNRGEAARGCGRNGSGILRMLERANYFQRKAPAPIGPSAGRKERAAQIHL